MFRLGTAMLLLLLAVASTAALPPLPRLGAPPPMQELLGEPGAYIGRAVCSDANTLVAGSYHSDGGVGAAYVYRRHAEGWRLAASLKPGDARHAQPSGIRGFGTACDVSGDAIAIGAFSYVNEAAAVYVYRRSSSISGDSFALEQVLTPPASTSRLYASTSLSLFGTAVALIDNDFLAVGARGLGPEASGCVLIYRKDAGSQLWSLGDQLFNQLDPRSGDWFGWSVSMQPAQLASDPDTDVVLAVSAVNHAKHGTVFVFAHSRKLGTWKQLARFEPPSSSDPLHMLFGWSVKLALPTLAITSPVSQSNPSVWLVDDVTDASPALRRLDAPHGVAPDQMFGYCCDLQADRLIVGAPDFHAASGAAWLFRRHSETGVWQVGVQVIGQHKSSLGASCALPGDLGPIVVGAPNVGDDFQGAYFVIRDDRDDHDDGLGREGGGGGFVGRDTRVPAISIDSYTVSG